MSELYNRYFSEPVQGGHKIHIEVCVEKIEDAVRLVLEHAQKINDDYEKNRQYYEQPKKGKLIKVEIKEDPLTIEEEFG